MWKIWARGAALAGGEVWNDSWCPIKDPQTDKKRTLSLRYVQDRKGNTEWRIFKENCASILWKRYYWKICPIDKLKEFYLRYVYDKKEDTEDNVFFSEKWARAIWVWSIREQLNTKILWKICLENWTQGKDPCGWKHRKKQLRVRKRGLLLREFFFLNKFSLKADFF